MEKQCFIRTSYPKVAEELRKLGFQEIEETGSKYYIFFNNGKMNFTNNEIDTDKIQYTDKLFL